MERRGFILIDKDRLKKPRLAPAEVEVISGGAGNEREHARPSKDRQRKRWMLKWTVERSAVRQFLKCNPSMTTVGERGDARFPRVCLPVLRDGLPTRPQPLPPSR